MCVDNGDSFRHRTQELDGPAHLISHQEVHVCHSFSHAASQMSQHALPFFIHHTCEQHLRERQTHRVVQRSKATLTRMNLTEQMSGYLSSCEVKSGRNGDIETNLSLVPVKLTKHSVMHFVSFGWFKLNDPS